MKSISKVGYELDVPDTASNSAVVPLSRAGNLLKRWAGLRLRHAEFSGIEILSELLSQAHRSKPFLDGVGVQSVDSCHYSPLVRLRMGLQNHFPGGEIMKKLLFVSILTFVGATAAFPSDKTNTHPVALAEQKTLTLDQIILEEYKALRAEIILCLGTRVTICSIGFATIGVLLAGALTAVSREKEHWLGASLIIGVGVTLASLYVLDVWVAETQRLARAGYHNCRLETKLQGLYPGSVAPLEWEHLVRSTDGPYARFMPSDDRGTPWIFLAISAASGIGGLVLFWKAAKSRRIVCWTVSVIGGLALVWSLSRHIIVVHCLRSLWSQC